MGERRDALKWVTAFSVAALFAVAQILRGGTAAADLRGPMIAGALFIVSIVAGVYFTAILDVQMSTLFFRRGATWQQDASLLARLGEVFKNVRRATPGSEEWNAATKELGEVAKKVRTQIDREKNYKLPRGVMGCAQSLYVAYACVAGFLAGLGVLVIDSLVRLRW